VSDKSVPVIDCSQINPITAEITDNSCRIALTITAPKAKDNCDKDITGTAVLPSTFGLGDTTITWKFVDAATNSSQCTQHIIVSDKSAPVIDCSKINPITAENYKQCLPYRSDYHRTKSEGQLRQGHHGHRRSAIYLWPWRYHHYMEVC
jgi:hypothetical protein